MDVFIVAHIPQMLKIHELHAPACASGIQLLASCWFAKHTNELYAHCVHVRDDAQYRRLQGPHENTHR